MAETLEEPSPPSPSGSVSPGGFVSTLNVEAMIEKLLNFKNTGKQVTTMIELHV